MYCTPVLYLGRTQEVVWGDAGLTKVDPLGPHEALGHHVEVGSGVHPHRTLAWNKTSLHCVQPYCTLASKLQGDGGQMLVGGLPDLPTDVPAPGKEDVVELLPEQLHGLLDATLDHVESLLVEVAGQETRHDVGGGSGNL